MSRYRHHRWQYQCTSRRHSVYMRKWQHIKNILSGLDDLVSWAADIKEFEEGSPEGSLWWDRRRDIPASWTKAADYRRYGLTWWADQPHYGTSEFYQPPDRRPDGVWWDIGQAPGADNHRLARPVQRWIEIGTKRRHWRIIEYGYEKAPHHWKSSGDGEPIFRTNLSFTHHHFRSVPT